MVKVSHNNVDVVIRVFVLKVTSTIVFVGLRTFTMGGVAIWVRMTLSAK